MHAAHLMVATWSSMLPWLWPLRLKYVCCTTLTAQGGWGAGGLAIALDSTQSAAIGGSQCAALFDFLPLLPPQCIGPARPCIAAQHLFLAVDSGPEVRGSVLALGFALRACRLLTVGSPKCLNRKPLKASQMAESGYLYVAGLHAPMTDSRKTSPTQGGSPTGRGPLCERRDCDLELIGFMRELIGGGERQRAWVAARRPGKGGQGVCLGVSARSWVCGMHGVWACKRQ